MRAVLVFLLVLLSFSLTAQASTAAIPAGADTIDTAMIYTVVDEPAEFPGGVAALLAFLTANIKYPIMEADNDIQGKVIVGFEVDRSGLVQNPRLIKSVSPGIDKEAIRVVKALPPFKPAVLKGQKVKVYFMLPVNFVLTRPVSK